MTPFRRWCVVAALAVASVGVPWAVRAWPVGDSSVSATALLTRMQAAHDHAYAGFVETQGALQLPSSDRFTGVGSLFGEGNRLRVWFRDPEAWRVDQLATAGESDLIHTGDVTTTYDYADAKATTSRDPEIRLPRASDLTPPSLGHTVLEGASADDVRRIGSRRVAGIAAPGLEITPSSPQTSIGHVDLWADPASGVPLRVEVYGKGSGGAAFTTTFDSFSSARPAASLVTFTRPHGVSGGYEPVLDIADAADQYAPLRPPDEVAGLTRSSTEHGAVGVYGTGLTRFIAIPLRDREADPLRKSLAATPGAKAVSLGQVTYPQGGGTGDLDVTVASTGPLGVLVTGVDGEGGWLVVGTVDRAALEQAAHDLTTGTLYVGFP